MNIFITGASRGIGRAIAEILGTHGFQRFDSFYISYKGNVEGINEVFKELMYYGNAVTIIKLDVKDRESIKKTVEVLAKSSDFKIDVLINNAGIVKDRTLKNMSDEEWDDVIDTNLTGIFNVTKALLPYMNNNGMIINITSVIGIIGGFGQVNYAASKAGVIGFTKALAKELAQRNIRVNAVACGFVDTDMTSNIPESIKSKILERIPLGRFAEPKEIASFIYWLINNGSYVTGSIFTIDGGLT